VPDVCDDTDNSRPLGVLVIGADAPTDRISIGEEGGGKGLIDDDGAIPGRIRIGERAAGNQRICMAWK